MSKLETIFNNKSNLDFNILVQNSIVRPQAEKEYEETLIPCGNKTIYYDKGYKDVDITVKYNFNSNNYDETWRQVKKWLMHNNNDNKLIISSDPGYYNKVNKVIIGTPERIIKRVGRFECKFTCEPFLYLIEGQNPMQLSNNIYNPYEETMPMFIIEGEGNLTLNINGNIVKFNVGQKVIVDVKKGLCYKADRSIINTTMEGYFEDMKLLEGDNYFNWTSGFNIKIIPNWRCL